jgi:hypothetical protein
MWKHKYFKTVLNVKVFILLFTFLPLTFYNPATNTKLILLTQRAGCFFGSLNIRKSYNCLIFFLLFSLHVAAQQTDSLKTTNNRFTTVSGRIVDDASGLPLADINVVFNGSSFGASSNQQGNFQLRAPGAFTLVTFSYVGYQSVTRAVKPGQVNNLQVRMHSRQTELKEVAIKSGRKQRYRNKDNPAVELIQQVIDHKDQNRMESADYLQYDQYERIGMSLFHLSPKLINGNFSASINS